MKRKENLDQLRKLLSEEPKPWGVLKKATGLSSSILKEAIDLLESSGELQAIPGRWKGRRTFLYGLANKEKTEAETLRYGVVKLIEGFEDPLAVREVSNDGELTVTVFISNIPRERQRQMLPTLGTHAKSWLPLAKKFLKLPRSEYKIAVVLTRAKPN